MNKYISKKGIVSLITLNGIAFSASFILNALNPALPVMMEQMKIPANIAQMLSTAYLLVSGIMMLLSPSLIARFNTRKIILASLWLFFTGNLCAIFSHNFIMLLGARILQGCCIGLYTPSIYLVFNSLVAKEHRGKVLGIINCFVCSSPVVAMLCAGILIDIFTWKSIFAVILPFSVLLLFLGYKYIDNYAEKSEKIFDALSFILAAVGLGSLLYAFSTFSATHNWRTTILLLTVGVVALFFFVRKQQQTEKPFLSFLPFCIMHFKFAIIAGALVAAITNACKLFVPIYLQNAMNISATDTGFFLLPSTICAAFCPAFIGRYIDKQYTKRIILCGVSAILFASLLFFFLPHPSIILLCCFYTIYIMGGAIISFSLTLLIANSLPQESMTHGISLFSSSRTLASSLGTAIIISIYMLFINTDTPSLLVMISGMRMVFAITAAVAVSLLFYSLYRLENRNTQKF